MNETNALEAADAAPQTDAEYKGEIDRLIAEMQGMVRHMADNRREFERSRDRTNVMLADIRSALKMD